MANHVYFNIFVQGVSEEQFDAAIKSEEVERTYWNSDEKFTVNEIVELERQPFMQHLNPEFDEDNYLKDSYDWYCTNVGAKWCHLEDAEDGWMRGHSAWRQPHELVLNLVQHLARTYDTQVSAEMTYEDEFRNFVGKSYYDSEKYEDGWDSFEGDWEEITGDDLVEMLKEEYPNLDTDDEDFDWWETNEEYDINPQEELDYTLEKWWESV